MKTRTPLFRIDRLLIAVALLATFGAMPEAKAQYQVTTLGSAVVENFNGMLVNTGANATNNSLNMINFNAALGDTTQTQRNSAWTIAPGNANFSRGGAVGNASFGANVTAASVYAAGNNAATTDRSLGFLGTANVPTANAVVQFANASGSTVTSVMIDYLGEQFQEQASRASFITVTYSTTSAAAALIGTSLALNFNALFNTGTNSRNGDAAANQFNPAAVNISGLSIANGSSIWFAFKYDRGGTTGSSQGLAIDDISVAFNGSAPVGTGVYWTANGTSLGDSGTWDTSGSNWSSATSPVSGNVWDSTKTAVFTNNAATVTVSTVSANAGMQFATDGYTLSSGTITLGGSAIASNTITTDAGVTATINSALSGSAGMTKAGAGNLVLGGTNNYTGGTLISAGVLQGDTTSLQGTITNSGSIVFNQSTNGAYGSVLSGAGTLIKIGASTLTLSGANAFTGAMSISNGAVRLSNATGAGTTAGGITVVSDAALELAGGIAVGAEALNLSGTGISSGGALRNISGNNTYGGTITNTAAARINSDAGTLTLSGAINATNQALTFGGAGNIAVSGAITNSTSTLIKDGAGTLTLSGANTYSGGTLVSGGRLIGTTTSLQGSITNNAAATFDQTTNGTYAGALTGSGSLVKSGAGVVTLSGANSYSGGTLVSAGGLVGTTTSLQGSITNNAAVTFNQNSDGTYNGAMSGTGSLNKTGSGEVTLSGNSTGYSGAITVGNGTLLAASDNAFGTGSVSVTNGSVLANSGRTIANGFTIGAAAGTEVYYSQDFNSIGTALPTGWTVRTNASANSIGTPNAFSTSELAWDNTSGAFKNFASATGLTSSSDTTAQDNATNRALGVRTTGGFGDPGAAFTYAFNTTGQTVSSISLDLMLLSSQPRTNVWSLQYGIGGSPTSFTSLGTWTTPDTWGTTSTNFASSLFSTNLNDLSNLVFRVVNLSASTGGGTQDSIAIDNFVVNTLGGPSGSGTLGISEAGSATFSGAITNNSVATLTAVSGGTATFSGAISGAGSVTKTGEGTVTLSGNNTFGGVLTVAEGKLTVSSVNNASQDGVLGNSANAVVLGASGQTGFLHYVGNTNASTDKTFTAATGGTAGIEASNAATTLTLSGAIGGAGNVQKGGAGTLLLAGNNTFTGALNVHDGTLEIASINNNSANGTLGNSTNPVSLGKSGTANVSTLLYTGGTASTTKGFSMASDATAGVINVANSGTTLTVSGPITGSSGSGLTKTGIGRLSLSGSSSYNGATAVSAGELNLSGGSIANSAVTVASGASLSGYGSVGTIGGAGAINPGNSPGILTTPQVNPSGGTDFNFEMTGTAPTYNNAASSVNDVIRITSGTPFSQALAAGNGINIYLSGAALFTGSTAVQYQGGFFTDQSASFASSISGATYNYYFANGAGSTTYNGASYYSKAQYESLVLGTNMLITVTTVAQTANFGSGNVSGQVMQVQVIPEPSTYALLGLSAAAFGAYRWRRRRRG